MENYDEIVRFDYTDENEWKGWVREKFLPLHTQTSTILKVREHLEYALKTNFKETFNQESIKEILLGGVTKEGEYTPNSLAKLYKDALGISINPKEWIAYCKAGLDPTENGIECKFEDTPFLTFVKEIKELVEEVLSKIEVEPQEVEDKEIEKIINSPERLLEVIREVYRSIVSISANHDYHMFFILNTRCIPRFFIEEAYPKLKDNFERVAKILELEEKFVPNVSDKKVREEYTLIGHRKDGFAYILYRLNGRIWKTSEVFQPIGVILGITFRNLKKEYYENANHTLEKMGWKKPEYIRISDPPSARHISGRSGPWFYTYYVEGIMITRYHEEGFSSRGHFYSGTYKCNISYLQLMRDVSPAAFLGIYLLETEGNKNTIEIVRSD